MIGENERTAVTGNSSDTLLAEIADLKNQIQSLKQENESIFKKIQNAQKFWGITIIVGCSALLLTIR